MHPRDRVVVVRVAVMEVDKAVSVVVDAVEVAAGVAGIGVTVVPPRSLVLRRASGLTHYWMAVLCAQSTSRASVPMPRRIARSGISAQW